MTDSVFIQPAPLPESDPLSRLPDEERRIILAWRTERQKARSGVAFLGAVLILGHVYLFAGLPSGKVLARSRSAEPEAPIAGGTRA